MFTQVLTHASWVVQDLNNGLRISIYATQHGNASVPRTSLNLLGAPLFGRCLVVEHARAKWRRCLGLAYQLSWDLEYALKAYFRNHPYLCFTSAPHPFGYDTLGEGKPHERVPVINITYKPTPQPATSSGYGKHGLVRVMPHPGSSTAPTHGFDPSLPSSLQAFERFDAGQMRAASR